MTMKHALLVALLVLAAAPAFAREMKCRADQPVQGGASIEFAPQVVQAGAVVEPDPAMFNGTPVAAVWRKASATESQSTLGMTMGDLTSTVYDLDEDKTGPINVMSGKDIRFQCWWD